MTLVAGEALALWKRRRMFPSASTTHESVPDPVIAMGMAGLEDVLIQPPDQCSDACSRVNAL